MSETNQALHILRAIHKGGAWLFDHSGPLAPMLARMGYIVYEQLFPHGLITNALNPVVLDGMRIYHEGRPSYHMQMFSMGLHDREVVRLVKDLVRPGMTVLDVGAHIGYFSLLCARLAGSSSKIWAFEPIPKVADILRKNIEENGFNNQIHVVPLAVSNKSGKAMFYINPAESMLSSLCQTAASYQESSRNQIDPTLKNRQCSNSVEVVCTTLDGWAAGQNWPPVDLIKIDIEGLEKSALEGMIELSRRNPRLKLIIELNPRTLSAAGVTIEDFWTALLNCGYNQVSMAHDPLRRVEYPGDLPKILREIRYQGNDRINLLCEMIAV